MAFGDYSQLVSMKPTKVSECWSVTAKSTSGTLTAAPGPAVLGSIFVCGGTLGFIQVYDNTSASGKVVANITAPSGGQWFGFNCRMDAGIAVLTTAATNYTLTYVR